MHVRPYQPTDLDEISAINAANVPAVGAETTAALGRIADMSTIALVAVADPADIDGSGESDTPVVAGFCLVLAPDAEYASKNFAWFAERFDNFLYLDRVAFAAPFQGRGWGRAMYREVHRLAAERAPSATDVLLEVNLVPRNDQSLAFHERLGFRQVGVLTHSPSYQVSMLASSLPPAPQQQR